MANEPGYRWGKKNSQQRAELTTSLSQRMTQARTVAASDDGKPRNAFGDRGDGKPIAAPVVEVPVVETVRINGKVVSDPVLVAAKLASDAERTKNHAERASASKLNAIAKDPATLNALARVWMAQTPSYWQTPFNGKSLSNAMTYMLEHSGRDVSIGLFDEVFAFLTEGNFLERRNQKRGEPNARLWEPNETPSQPQAAPRAAYVPPTPDEVKALRATPLADLAKSVRAGYKIEGARR